MIPEEVLELAEYITERFDPTEADNLRVILDDHVEGCARGKHIKGWLRSQHKPHRPYLRWLADQGAKCECHFMMKIFPKAYAWELSRTCAWCKKEIREDVEVFGISAKARSQEEIADREGSFMQFQLELRDTQVHGFAVTSDSEAKAQGWDFVFGACSIDCARSLRGAMKLETDVIDAISDF